MPKTLYDVKPGEEILITVFDGNVGIEVPYIVKRRGGGWRDDRSEETTMTLQRKEKN